MAQRTQVPKFGNWENEEDVPYTAYFEKAKKGRNAKTNPQIPDPSSNGEPSSQALEEAEVKRVDPRRSEPEIPKGPDGSRTKDEVDLRKSSDSSTHQKRVLRHGVGSDRSVDNSPMHPHHQARVGNRGSAGSSPMWERKVSSEGSHGAAPSTPGRSRLRPVNRGDETPDDGPAVPIFGDWDDKDPASAEGYTHIFNKVREEKQTGGGGKSPMVTADNANFYGQNRHGNDNQKVCGCFPWSRK